MKEYFRKNWLNILMAIIAAISGADAAAGMRAGKSATNVTVIPSILAAIGASGALGVRWLNNRTVVAKSIRQGLDPAFLDRIENLYSLARDPDVTPDHAAHLADMAGDLLLAENRRAKAEWLEANRPVQVFNAPPVNPNLREEIERYLNSTRVFTKASPTSPAETVMPPETKTQDAPSQGVER